MGERPTVPVGPFHVADLERAALVETIAEKAAARLGRRPYVAFALHVGGLNARHDRAYVAAHQRADLTYADGASVVLLARLAGARRIQRAGTTDIGWDVLAALAARLGRPLRLGLVGGSPGLAARAGEVLTERLDVETRFTCDGYRENWTEPLDQLRRAGCDAVVIGLGAPREMHWVIEHLAELPPGLILTCGGWFGFVVGAETRAPITAQRLGLEWMFRLAQAPRRLGGRYARGAWSTLVLAAAAIVPRPAASSDCGAAHPPPPVVPSRRLG